MENYISRHSGAEIDAAIEQVQYKINKPEGALKDEILIFDGSNWISSNFTNKHNTQAVWDTMTNYIPNKGEIIVYDRDDNTNYERFKIGDGIKTISQLPFYMEDLREHTQNTDIHVTAEEKAVWNTRTDASFKPAGKSYLTFSSPNSFTLAVNDMTKHWDGTLEYFASDKTWTTWDGTNTLDSINNDNEYVLYLRGTGNTMITGDSQSYHWILNGSDIACVGNIEYLLDYITVESGEHPIMMDYCYSYMFQDCTGLTQAPTLPATTLTYYCYSNMFQGCTGLTQAPELSATRLAEGCYKEMFYGCTSITQAPDLPATKLANYCYNGMFAGCTMLTQAPTLPATTLKTYCYYGLFKNCISLVQVPNLPATRLAEGCYKEMFYGCTGLKLSATQTKEYTQKYRIPEDGAGITATDALIDMFTGTSGTFTGTPSIDTLYYLSSDNIVVYNTETATLNSYIGSIIDQRVSDIPAPDVSGQIDTHNTNTSAHNDIRELITGLTTRLNAIADSDDTTLDQLSEIVDYIKNNKNLIDGITTSKVNVSDIINNLTTNVTNKPLSAAQGVALKALIDTIAVPTKISQLENDSGYLTSFTETDPTVPAWAKATNKPTYTASEVGAVPTSRKINGKALSSDITLSASDVGAKPSSWTPSASDIDAVPTSRTINGKALSSDITLNASDVGSVTINEVNTAIQTAIGNAIGGRY